MQLPVAHTWRLCWRACWSKDSVCWWEETSAIRRLSAVSSCNVFRLSCTIHVSEKSSNFAVLNKEEGYSVLPKMDLQAFWVSWTINHPSDKVRRGFGNLIQLTVSLLQLVQVIIMVGLQSLQLIHGLLIPLLQGFKPLPCLQHLGGYKLSWWSLCTFQVLLEETFLSFIIFQALHNRIAGHHAFICGIPNLQHLPSGSVWVLICLNQIMQDELHWASYVQLSSMMHIEIWQLHWKSEFGCSLNVPHGVGLLQEEEPQGFAVVASQLLAVAQG